MNLISFLVHRSWSWNAKDAIGWSVPCVRRNYVGQQKRAVGDPKVKVIPAEAVAAHPTNDAIQNAEIVIRIQKSFFVSPITDQLLNNFVLISFRVDYISIT